MARPKRVYPNKVLDFINSKAEGEYKKELNKH